MLTVPSPDASSSSPVARRPLYHFALRAAAATAMLGLGGLLAACTPPKFPDTAPTKEEVPFLGQQMTQEQINRWLAQIAAQRAQLQQQLHEQKVACYQRFFVNTCLRTNQQAHQEKMAVLRKQEIELRRQERVLIEVDKQLRLKEHGQQLP